MTNLLDFLAAFPEHLPTLAAFGLVLWHFGVPLCLGFLLGRLQSGRNS